MSLELRGFLFTKETQGEGHSSTVWLRKTDFNCIFTPAFAHPQLIGNLVQATEAVVARSMRQAGKSRACRASGLRESGRGVPRVKARTRQGEKKSVLFFSSPKGTNWKTESLFTSQSHEVDSNLTHLVFVCLSV